MKTKEQFRGDIAAFSEWLTNRRDSRLAPAGRPERFKTQTAHFSILRDGRTGRQRETLGKSGFEAAS